MNSIIINHPYEEIMESQEFYYLTFITKWNKGNKNMSIWADMQVMTSNGRSNMKQLRNYQLTCLLPIHAT